MVVTFLFRQLLVGYSRHLAVIYARREHLVSPGKVVQYVRRSSTSVFICSELQCG